MDNEQQNGTKAYSPDLNLIQILNKKWEECTDAERITKLREVCKQLQHNTQLISQLEGRIRPLELHTHTDGKVVVPLNSGAQGLMGTGFVGNSLMRQNPLD